MVRKPPPAKKPLGGLKPGLVVLGTMLLWAALNEPARLGTVSLALWVLSAFTIGLVVSAGLLLATPLAQVLLALVARLGRHLEGKAEDR